jgi:hypothetical protein
VKVVGTGRDDINGLLGIVTSYNVDRERYLVHMTTSQSMMALKRENLVRASFFESYRAQWEQLKNDPRVREKVAHYVRWGQQHVQPYNLWHVLAGLGVLQLILLYAVGLAKTVMVDSLFVLLLVIALPDFVARTPWSIALRRFPTRARDTLELQMPVLKGRLSERTALIIVLVLVAFCLQSLFTTTGRPKTPPMPTSSSNTNPSVAGPPTKSGSTTIIGASPNQHSPFVLTPELMERYYNLGYNDATDGNEKGTSIRKEIEELTRKVQQVVSVDGDGPTRVLTEDDPLLEGGYVDLYYPTSPGRGPTMTTTPPSQSKSVLSKLLNFSTMGSLYYIYKLLKEKGTEPTTNLFSIGQLAANLQHHTEPWQQGMLLFSVYNVLRMLF